MPSMTATSLRLATTAKGIAVGDDCGRLVLLGPHFQLPRESDRSKREWFGVYQCNCGTIGVYRAMSVASGDTKSCGCIYMETRTPIVHGGSGTRLFKIWQGMRFRCRNHRNRSFVNYGGRGIRVCREWDDDFAIFRDWAFANGYRDNLEIDRINNDGNYEPNNCRWVTRKINSLNRRCTIFVEAFGERRTLSDWCDHPCCAVAVKTLGHRIRAGWMPEAALALPFGERESSYADFVDEGGLNSWWLASRGSRTPRPDVLSAVLELASRMKREPVGSQ